MKALRTIGAWTVTAALLAALAIGLPRLDAAQAASIDEMAQQPNRHGLPENAAPYLALPEKRLRELVPPLKGLKYDADQDRLPTILAGVAAKIASVLPRLPNLVSREEIFHFQSRSGSANGGLASEQPWTREFKYLILSHHYTDGSTAIEELRTDSKGRPADASAQFTSPHGFGFAYQWLFFRTENQSEFRFRYLGEQDKEGRKTFVVAFAQDPAKVTNPAHFQALGKVASFFYQGVLWIDQASFDIVMLRSDLLSPLPDLGLRQMTTELTFRSVPIHGFGEVFWLPSQVYISSDQGAGPVEETHRYSDYHLFHAEARIVDTP
jgi:hypothetical protein